MDKKERQWIDSQIPKCSCGNNLSRQRQENGIEECPSCLPDYIRDVPPGNYTVKITSLTVHNDGTLQPEFEITEGEFEGEIIT